MRYLPHTQQDIDEMLAAINAPSIEALFEQIPKQYRFDQPPQLPQPLDEWQLRKHLQALADSGGGSFQAFLGAGSQPHHIPALVPQLAGRSEFLTSYTPYQPEISQGTLQAIFEYQTLIARLTQLPVANASLYDGATSLAEAALMAMRITKRQTVVVAKAVHPHYRQVLATYLAPLAEVKIIELPLAPDGRTDLTQLADTTEPAVLILQSPNFLGCVEDLAAAAEKAHAAGALLAAGFTEPFSLGILKAPGECGADIAFGEGQSLGSPQNFGGPGLGIIACKNEFMRQIPGRLVGQTTDNRGQRGFVLTLSTREQHIRRGKAVSNICSNAGHTALTAAVFMAAIGGSGFRRLSQLNRDLGEYLKAGLVRLGFKPLSNAATFNEFTAAAPAGFAEKRQALLGEQILAGLNLQSHYPELGRNAWLFGVTEVAGKDGIDQLLRLLAA